MLAPRASSGSSKAPPTPSASLCSGSGYPSPPVPARNSRALIGARQKTPSAQVRPGVTYRAESVQGLGLYLPVSKFTVGP